jgi:ankyrin repeat protein
MCCGDASSAEQVAVVLLANGADPNRVTKSGAATECFMRDARTRAETSLHRAAAFGSERTIELLLDAGAIIDSKDMNGDTPLSWASWYKRPDSVLRKLLYGEFSIHLGRRPMSESLGGSTQV